LGGDFNYPDTYTQRLSFEFELHDKAKLCFNEQNVFIMLDMSGAANFETASTLGFFGTNKCCWHREQGDIKMDGKRRKGQRY